jgi:hypothetical protein
MKEWGRKAPFRGYQRFGLLEAIWRDFGKCDVIHDLGEIGASRKLQRGRARKCTGECSDVKPRRTLR